MTERLAAADKHTLRRELSARRRRRGAAELTELGDHLAEVVMALAEVRTAGTVAAYVSVGSEPGTHPLLERLRGSGKTVLLPLTNDDMTLDWAAYQGMAALTTARFGLLEPTGDRLGPDAVRAADVVCVPAAAVDVTGLRLGRGGGCYDRVIGMLGEGATTCALLYADELVEAVPAEPHDLRVHVAATPAGVTRFPATSR